MKKHLVTLHCGHTMMANSPAQRFCNRQCAGYFVTRRPGAKKINRKTGSQGKVSSNLCHLDSNDPLWNSAYRCLTKNGYIQLTVYLPDLKLAVSRMEHIVTWEKAHGKQVPKGWVIHHRNETKDDNDISNLVVLPRTLHKELHIRLQQFYVACSGYDYLKKRHELTLEYINRSTELADLRRAWYAA